MEDNHDPDEIERYSKLSQQELMVEFGRVLTAGAVHGQPVNDDELRRTGERWFDSFREKAKPVICKPAILDQLQGTNAHRTTIIGLIINYLLAADMHCPVPLGSVAVALFNYGVGRICAD